MMATKAIGDWLLAPGETDEVVSRAKRLLALERLYANCVPEPLLRASSVANLKDGTLLLTADNGAVASKLKHLAPKLLKAIRENNQEVTDIQVTVRVNIEASPDPASHKPALSPEGVHQIEALTETLPESSLKVALLRLAARQRSYLK